MTEHTPTSPAYQLPDGRALSTAAHAAMDASFKALDRLGRVMTVVTAAGVRDTLTNNDPAAPFDAAYAELRESADGSLWLSGRYWTAAGEERTFAGTPGLHDADTCLHELGEWTHYLDDRTSDVWRPLVTVLPDADGRKVYRLDLAKAAALPLD